MADRRGLASGIAAYGLWGLFPLYWPLLRPADPAEILAHRILWTFGAVLVIIAVQRNWHRLRRVTGRQVGLLALAAVVISGNWFTYIYAVNSDQTIEAALGYFINPLISVVLGVSLFRERLRRWQWMAIGLSVIAVLVLTISYGRPPWIALVLAGTFGSYGLIKKYADMRSAEGLTIETAVLFVPVLGYILLLQAQGTATFGHAGLPHALLMVGAGIVTAIPLLLFNAAATRIPLSVIGMLQYLAPTLQFLVGLLILREEMPTSRWIGFLLVWTALIILTVDGLRASRRNRLRARQDGAAVPAYRSASR